MDASNNSTASNVAQAILAVLDYNSTPDARRAAVAFLESVCIPKNFNFLHFLNRFASGYLTVCWSKCFQL